MNSAFISNGTDRKFKLQYIHGTSLPDNYQLPLYFDFLAGYRMNYRKILRIVLVLSPARVVTDVCAQSKFQNVSRRLRRKQCCCRYFTIISAFFSVAVAFSARFWVVSPRFWSPMQSHVAVWRPFWRPRPVLRELSTYSRGTSKMIWTPSSVFVSMATI